MLVDEEVKQMMEDLSTSPDFLTSLLAFYEGTEGDSIDIPTMASWFFSQGYLSCHEAIKRQKMTRPFNSDLKAYWGANKNDKDNQETTKTNRISNDS